MGKNGPQLFVAGFVGAASVIITIAFADSKLAASVFGALRELVMNREGGAFRSQAAREAPETVRSRNRNAERVCT